MTIALAPSSEARDYTWLLSEIAAWLHRSDLETQIPTFLALAEQRIYRELRTRTMEAVLSGTTADGVLTLPADYLDLKYLRISGRRPIERRTADWIYDNQPDLTGEPRYCAREGDSLIFAPEAGDGTALVGMYYKRLPPLSLENPTNWFTENAVGLLIYGALSEAAPFLQNDERLGTWQAKYVELRDQVQNEERGEQYSGSPLTIKPRL